MKNWKLTLKRFLRDEEGQSTTEYILILAVVVMIAMKFKQTIVPQMQSATEQIGGKITETLNEE